MIESKKVGLLFFSFFLFIFSYAQDLKWILGTWKGTGTIYGSEYKTQFIRTLIIDSVYGDNFKGTRTNEADDRSHAKIITSFSGYVNKNKFHIQYGIILYKKEPPHGQWLDCSHCTPENKVIIKQDSIIIRSEITGCQKYCDQISIYYKLLCDYDTITQRYLVNLFGTPLDIQAFKPCIKKPPPVIAADIEEKQQQLQDSIQNAANIAKKRQQQVDDSLKIAANIAAKRQQQVQDSLQNAANIAKKQQQKRVEDSLKNAAAIAKKKQQQVDDSLKIAAAIAKKKQQQVDDSLKIAAAIAMKRQQEVQDSLQNAANIAKKQQQKRVEDSLKNATAIAKKKQQQVDDSLRIAAAIAMKKQQQVQDSIQKAAAIAKKQQQKVEDSLKNAAVIAKKRQQQVDDSLKIAASIAKKQQQKQIEDSLKMAAVIAKKKQQQVDDSLKLAASIAVKKPDVKDSATSLARPDDKSKALVQRDNVLLQTYHIKTPDILIELFDNAQIDGDRVSVYHNNVLIVDNQALLREPIVFTIRADSSIRTHEFILVAENLGTLPPNTALMRITVGGQVYKLGVKTDLQTNAKIVFYYDGN